jgi:hypothetical protein
VAVSQKAAQATAPKLFGTTTSFFVNDLDTGCTLAGMDDAHLENKELMLLLADIERKRRSIRRELEDTYRVRFWTYALMGLNITLICGSQIFMLVCYLLR